MVLSGCGLKHELYAGKVALVLDISLLRPPHLHECGNGGGTFGNANVAEHKGCAVHGFIGQKAESALTDILSPAFQW